MPPKRGSPRGTVVPPRQAEEDNGQASCSGDEDDPKSDESTPIAADKSSIYAPEPPERRVWLAEAVSRNCCRRMGRRKVLRRKKNLYAAVGPDDSSGDEKFEDHTLPDWRSHNNRCLLLALVSSAGIWTGMVMIARSYPAPDFYRPEGWTAMDVLDKPGLFLPPFGKSVIDVEGKANLENTGHPESGRVRPGGRRWVDSFILDQSSLLALAGCATVMLSGALLTIASKSLTRLREQLIARPLQRLPQLRVIPRWLAKHWPCWTYGEWLCNVLMVFICVYWTVPPKRCRNRCDRRPANLSAVDAASYQPVCQLTCTRWPWPFGDGNIRHFATHLGTVSGYSMGLAMVPVPKNSPMLHLAGLTFERGVQIHRVMGRVAVVAGVLHGAGYVYYWEQRGSRNGDAFLSRTLLMSSPICPYEPVIPWPWNSTTGEWLNGSKWPTGWGVPVGADNYTGDAARRCPWLSDASHLENTYVCADGQACRGYYCCQERVSDLLAIV
eukprot:COSAG05_NODE_760_length_7489_cov_1.989716_8_plen_495_part_01